MTMPDFTEANRLTAAGQRVVDHIEAVLTEALGKCQGQDVTPLNELSGPYQDYYAMVRSTKAVPVVDWVKGRNYGVSKIFESLEAADREAEAAAAQEERTTGIEAKLADLETKLAEALRQLAAKDEQIAGMTESDTAAEDDTEDEPTDADPEPEKPARKRRTPKAQKGDAPAETDAEGDTETADTDETED